jgi:hypothetical protein
MGINITRVLRNTAREVEDKLLDPYWITDGIIKRFTVVSVPYCYASLTNECLIFNKIIKNIFPEKFWNGM